jgi:hypothetical protein
VFSWIETEFQTVQFGDVRRSKRFKKVLEAMWQSPGASQRGAAGTWAEAIGSYRLWKASEVTDEAILAAHQDQVRERSRAHRMILHIQDTTELDMTPHKQLQSGPLTESTRRGLFAHSEYVLQEDGVPLGLWYSHLWTRSDEEYGQTHLRKKQPIEEKESLRWLEAFGRACHLRALCPKQLVISLADREGDIYEIFEEYEQRLGRGEPVAHWIIRSQHNRAITSVNEQDLEEHARLKAVVEAAPLLGIKSLEIRSKKQCNKVKGSRKWTLRTARTAQLEIRASVMELRPPRRPGGQKLTPLSITVLMAKEIDPPAGEPPIEWILLTPFKVRTLKKALQILRIYALRWQIEVFHKILKSGCRVEDHPPEEIERLRPRLAAQMILAWRIHYVTLAGRECPELSADVVFDEWEWKPMVVMVYGKDAPLKPPTLAQMIAWIAKLGGYIGRKGDGPPGPQSIWKGIAKMLAYGELWRALHGLSQETSLAEQPP